MDTIGKAAKLTVPLIGSVLAAWACHGVDPWDEDSGSDIGAEGDSVDHDAAPDVVDPLDDLTDPIPDLFDAPPDSADPPLDTPPDGAPDTGDTACTEDDVPIHLETVRIMLVLDQSSSMDGFRWTFTTNALRTMITDPGYSEVHFGLDAFPDGYPGSWSSCGSMCLGCRDDECGTLFPPQVAVDLASVSASAIDAHLSDSSYPQFCTFTPLVDQMSYYDTGPGPTDAPEMYLSDGSSYLVVLSDGENSDFCGGEPAVTNLATHTSGINTTHGIKSVAVGIAVDGSGSHPAQLGAIASNGGTSFTTYTNVTNETELTSTLNNMLSVFIECVYVVENPGLITEPGRINLYLDSAVVPYDAGCTGTSGEGWSWGATDHSEIQLCGTRCTSVKNGDIASVTATRGCPTIS